MTVCTELDKKNKERRRISHIHVRCASEHLSTVWDANDHLASFLLHQPCAAMFFHLKMTGQILYKAAHFFVWAETTFFLCPNVACLCSHLSDESCFGLKCAPSVKTWQILHHPTCQRRNMSHELSKQTGKKYLTYYTFCQGVVDRCRHIIAFLQLWHTNICLLLLIFIIRHDIRNMLTIF